MNNMAHAVLRLLEKNKIDYTLVEHPLPYLIWRSCTRRDWSTVTPLPRICWSATRRSAFTGCWYCTEKSVPT